jgi:DNA polymerase-3 subunit epsilon
LDLETTGTSPRTDRVVEIAVAKFLPDGRRFDACCRVHPTIPIPAAATAVHGITDVAVADCPTFATIASRLDRFLRGADLAGFGIRRFDLPLLLAEFARAGLRFSLVGRAVIDVLQIFHTHVPRDLAAAVHHYLGRTHDGAHSALVDVNATAAILDAQLAQDADLPRTVPELHARLTDVDLAGRLRRQGNRLVLTFGRYAGTALDEVVRNDPGYLHWLLGQDFLEDFQAFIQSALSHGANSGD